MSVVHNPGGGEELSIGGSSLFIKADSAATDGTFAMTETTLEPGFPGPPPHFHEAFNDVFYVLDGTVTVRVGDEVHELGPGGFACITPGTVHTFSNATEVPARVLNLSIPGGFEGYLRDMAAAMEGGGFEPAVAAEIAQRYDFKLAE
jgi:quercetin dioxygenase-like cupin family protein